MTPETIRRLDELFNTMPVLLGGPVSMGEIEAAERRVGMEFPRDYREFVGRYGGAMVRSLPILGLRKAEVMGDDTYSVIDMTARFRADGWKPTDEWIVISMDLAGNPIGLTAKGEVLISDHDTGEIGVVARTFEGFVLQLLGKYPFIGMDHG